MTSMSLQVLLCISLLLFIFPPKVHLKQRKQIEPVSVKIYDHRAIHDPKSQFGKGPWRYYGYGYGIHYGWVPDKTHEFERGYGYVKAFGRDFCKYGYGSPLCRPSHPGPFDFEGNRIPYGYRFNEQEVQSEY